MANNYLHSQLNGPIATSLMDAVEFVANKYDSALMAWFTASIENSDENMANFIGFLIGFPRPNVSSGAFNPNLLTFSSDTTGTTPPGINTLTGFGDTVDNTIGGKFDDTNVKTPMPLGFYKKLLKSVAILKYSGVNMSTIFSLASDFSPNFTYSFATSGAGNGDINIQFNTPGIGAGELYVLQAATDYVTFSPRIIFSNA